MTECVQQARGEQTSCNGSDQHTAAQLDGVAASLL